MAAQSVSRDNTLVCKSRFQPYTAYGALAYFVIIIIFNGWKVFTHGNWSIEDFITAYVVIPIYFAFYLFWEILKRTSFVKALEAEIWTGKTALDAEVWPGVVAKNWLERAWYQIAYLGKLQHSRLRKRGLSRLAAA